jgi:hypothetical protein
LNYMSLGMHNYFARCPQRPRALLALRPSQLAAADTTGPITWAGRRHVSPAQRALAAAGCWRLQAGPHYDAGPSRARPALAAGHAHPASPWPHRLTSSISARVATAPRALPPCFFSVSVSPSMFTGRCAGQGSLRKCLRRLGREPAGS